MMSAAVCDLNYGMMCVVKYDQRQSVYVGYHLYAI